MKEYIPLEIEIIEFENEDIITTSDGNGSSSNDPVTPEIPF